METEMEIRHLRREVKTALEMAVVALAPSQLINRLATDAGMLELLNELPVDCAPAIALAPKTLERARAHLDEWRSWERGSLRKALA